MKSSAPYKPAGYTGDPKWLAVARELVDATYYRIAQDAMADVIATALEAASRDGEMMAKALARIAELETESRVVQEANKRLAAERAEWQLLTESAEFKFGEAQAQCAVMREALEWIERETYPEDGISFERLNHKASAALSQDAGEALLERVRLLEAVAEKARECEYGCDCEYDYRCGRCQSVIDLREAVSALEKGRAP